jgi:hypothetical protein
LHLYQGTSEQFIAEAVQARLANRLADRFFREFRNKPSPSEVMSWRSSLGGPSIVFRVIRESVSGIFSQTEALKCRLWLAADRCR